MTRPAPGQMSFRTCAAEYAPLHMANEGVEPAQAVPAPTSEQPAAVRARLASAVPRLVWILAAAVREVTGRNP